MSASGFIDLRSDTVTHPTPTMRRAMAEAEVGDDQSREDPTVARLEARAAELLGKEAALYVSSGTMGNLVALLTHGSRGDAVILGGESHILWYEEGGAAALGGLAYHVLPNTRFGEIDLDGIGGVLRASGHDDQRVRVIAIENTHNRCGGTVLSPSYLNGLKSLARPHGVMVHMDGARIFNAVAASGRSAAEIAVDADTVQFCLSKGLAAPVGSMLVGPRNVIETARHRRQQVGGAMRQAGVIAAAGLVALDEMRDRLAEDNARARRLAEGLAAIGTVDIDLETVQTNIVVFRLTSGGDLQPIARQFREHGILISGFGERGLRMVTHYEIDDVAIERTLSVAGQILAGTRQSVAAR